MKVLLKVAVGAVAAMAVTVTAVVAVMIQLLERLLPVVLIGAAVAAVIWLLLRCRPARGAVTSDGCHPSAWTYPPAAPVVWVPPAPPAPPVTVTQGDHAGAYLHWGPPCEFDLDAPCVVTTAGRRP